jgi:hypothetical protein
MASVAQVLAAAHAPDTQSQYTVGTAEPPRTSLRRAGTQQPSPTTSTSSVQSRRSPPPQQPPQQQQQQQAPAHDGSPGPAPSMYDYDAFPMPPGPQHSLSAPAVPQLSQLPAQMQAHQQQQQQHQQQAHQQQQAPGPAAPRALRMPPAFLAQFEAPSPDPLAQLQQVQSAPAYPTPGQAQGLGVGLMAAAQAQAQGLLPAAWQLTPELIADFERFQVRARAPVLVHE